MNSKALRVYLALFAAIAVLVSSMSVLVTKSLLSSHVQAELDHTAPSIHLADIDGNIFSLHAHRGENVMLFFASPRCPISCDYMERIRRLASTHRDVPLTVVQILCGRDAIDAELINDLRTKTSERGAIPVLLDPNCEIAGAYGTVCTPTTCVIDAEGKLRYSGAFDDNRKESLVTHPYVEDTLRRITDGVPMAISSTQVFGYPIGKPK